MILLVGERGFEPPTPWSRTRCSTRLSHSPTFNFHLQTRDPIPAASWSIGLRGLRPARRSLRCGFEREATHTALSAFATPHRFYRSCVFFAGRGRAPTSGSPHPGSGAGFNLRWTIMRESKWPAANGRPRPTDAAPPENSRDHHERTHS